MEYTLQSNHTVRKEGTLSLYFEPNSNDKTIEFFKDGKFIGQAYRNGHHLTYNPSKPRWFAKLFGFHKNSTKPNSKILKFIFFKSSYQSLPYVLYYFGYKPEKD
jgi:hypothetical protein